MVFAGHLRKTESFFGVTQVLNSGLCLERQLAGQLQALCFVHTVKVFGGLPRLLSFELDCRFRI